jgi:Dyp-type peroxidase family
MRRDLTIKSGNLAGTSDFRVLAPIKKGLVPALDTMTYKTRVKLVLRGLHAGRAGGFEYELARILSDAVERVGVIHSVGIAVLEPEDKVLLTATFDGSWESYVRVIWQKVSRLLDLVFCNTEDYVLGYENSYEQWGAWLKRSQSEAYFLYATPDLTVDDTRYLRMQERTYRREAVDAADSRVTRIKIPTAEDIARQSIFGKAGDAIGTDPTNVGFGERLKKQYAGRPPFRQGVRSLVGLYRLADFFPPGTKDGEVLHRAAQELLPEFLDMAGDGVYHTGIVRALKRFPEPMAWLLQNPYAEPEVRCGLPLEPPAEQPLKDAGNVQGGIVSAYPDVHHGCLLLLSFRGPSALAAFLSAMPFRSEADELQPGQIAINISFTVEGLRVAGLSESEVLKLPDEFVQGMERRAGLLGDLRINHPHRWRLPALNWHLGVDAPDIAEDDPAPRIDLSAVHAIIQIRRRGPHEHAAESKAHLMAEMKRLVASDPGVTPLSLQWMKRQRNSAGDVEEHFGFIDGTSNPQLNKSKAGKRYSNHVNLGEILCGYPNLADKIGDYAKLADKTDGDVDAAFVQSLLHDGSFLAIRKLRQDVEALDEALIAAQAQAADAGQGLTREDFMAKMMGRWPGSHPKAGQPLAVVLEPPTKDSNDFHFETDKDGKLCPFHAHIRRANPRIRNPEAGSRPPRFVRRGMSYGPHVRREHDGRTSRDSLDQERGLIFMAYNANLGEQYELVQRWLNGANSSGSYSGQGDPLFGAAEAGRRRYFRFDHEGQTIRMALDGSDRLHEEPRPFVRLEWGAYLFAPSRKALASLQERAAAQGNKRAVVWSADAGETEIARLRDLETRLGQAEAFTAWKTALEDPDAATNFTTASIWAAIRERHGGVLRTPFGVLAADRRLLDQVTTDTNRNLTITAYLPRMRRSFGVLYLGLDPGQEDGAYERESEACNRAIMALDRHSTFDQARQQTSDKLQSLVKEAIGYAKDDGETSWDLTVDAHELIDHVLGHFCEEWFGLSEDGGCFRRAGYRWDWQPGQPPNYPGHFMSPSRYIFQPHPGPAVESIGAAHGAAVRRAMIDFLGRPETKATTAPVTRAVLDSEAGKASLGCAASTIAGAMMGFLPTVDGSLRRILNEWLREGTLWSLRGRFGGSKAADFTDACHRLGDAFIPAMQLRAVPELIWRTATVTHTMGEGPHQVTVNPGDIVVAGAISAAQQNLQEGSQDLSPAFGGNRKLKDHPTHACPGADPALAVMIGFFSALVESPLPLRAGPAPLTLAADGRLPPPNQDFNSKLQATVSPGQAHEVEVNAGTSRRAATPLLAIGDSWLFDQWDREFGVVRANLTKSLLKFGYRDIGSGTSEITSAGRLLSGLARPPFLRDLTNYLADEPGIKAVLVGAGCNDLVAGLPGQQPLYKMLKPFGGGDDPLDQAAVSSFIDGALSGCYDAVIKTLTANSKIPVIIHGYDHPIPDGRGDQVLIDPAGPWLLPFFEARGYDITHKPQRLALASEVMKRLFDRLNAAIKKVAAAYPNRAYYVDLTGTLAKTYGDADKYTLLWANELHPNEQGFDLLAAQVAKQLKDLKIG